MKSRRSAAGSGLAGHGGLGGPAVDLSERDQRRIGLCRGHPRPDSGAETRRADSGERRLAQDETSCDNEVAHRDAPGRDATRLSAQEEKAEETGSIRTAEAGSSGADPGTGRPVQPGHPSVPAEPAKPAPAPKPAPVKPTKPAPTPKPAPVKPAPVKTGQEHRKRRRVQRVSGSLHREVGGGGEIGGYTKNGQKHLVVSGEAGVTTAKASTSPTTSPRPGSTCGDRPKPRWVAAGWSSR